MSNSVAELVKELESDGVERDGIDALLRMAGEDTARLARALKRLRLGDPLPYVARAVRVAQRDFFVDRRVYRPSASTEHLLQHALSHIGPEDTVVDVGTGCGWMAITIKLEQPRARVVACDIDPDALEVASVNARRYGVDIELFESDLTSNPNIPAPTVVVANLPYGDPVASDARHSINAHMPRIALYHPVGPFAAFQELVASLRARDFKPRVFVESGSLTEDVVGRVMPAGANWRQVRFAPRVSIVDVQL